MWAKGRQFSTVQRTMQSNKGPSKGLRQVDDDQVARETSFRWADFATGLGTKSFDDGFGSLWLCRTVMSSTLGPRTGLSRTLYQGAGLAKLRLSMRN